MKKISMAQKITFLLLGLTLASCTSVVVPGNSSNPASSAPSSSSSSTPAVCDASETYSFAHDYVADVKLTQSYTGKHFLTDGIGAVKLKEKVDGDTAHFAQLDGDTGTIKGRYLCIDTPESTGMVEPWGHGASVYNGTMLTNAKQIVLTSGLSASKPALDSTGSRYLVYVWTSDVEGGDLSTFKLVNLALVQTGWSKAKGATGTDYGESFIKAASQAQQASLHVWSNEKDPCFNYNAPTTTTLKAIIDGVDSDGKAFDWTGAKATFTGIVVETGPDKGAAFVNKDFTYSENGVDVTRRYGIYIFTSYVEFAPLKTIGNEVQITGLISEYQGVKQVVGVSYSAYYPSDDDMKILSKNNVMAPLTGTAKALGIDQNINIVCTATLKCTGGYATPNTATTTANTFTLYCQDDTASLNIYIVDSIFITNVQDGSRVETVDYFKNATSLTVTGGLVTYTTSTGKKTYQIKLCRAADLVVTY